MPAKFYQQLITILVMSSFLMANLGVGKAYDLWVNGWGGIAGFLAIGVGLKMAKDVGMANAAKPEASPNVDIAGSSVTVEAGPTPDANLAGSDQATRGL